MTASSSDQRPWPALVGFGGLLILAGFLIRQNATPTTRSVQLESGFTHQVFATRDMISHPVSICVDRQNRVLVAETHRFEFQRYDDFEPQLAARTASDAARLRSESSSSSGKPEVLRIVADMDGDGRADVTRPFAEVHGTGGCASAIATRGSEAWFGVAPELVRVRDTDGDLVADQQQTLLRGFGVRSKISGHDLNSMAWGPDGRLYMCMGDRGVDIQTTNPNTAETKRIHVPDCGCVLRCEPDGSQLELFATGLRNPQGLVFDRFGNLWTADNDSNRGDQSRWINVVEGGDYGWRIGFQLMPRCGPWHEEHLWEQDVDVPWRLPAAGFIGQGPSGIAYNPGTGLPSQYDNHFLLADYADGLHALHVNAMGAGFEISRSQKLADIQAPTDVAFGTDGSIFVSDWIWPYHTRGQGRILRVTCRDGRDESLVKETARLLRTGMTDRATDELLRLLAHRDQRVRFDAQHELVERGETVVASLSEVGRSSIDVMAKLHAIWALGQLGRKGASVQSLLCERLGDEHPEIRSQAARVLGDVPHADNLDGLISVLNDESSRVRAHALRALAKHAVFGSEHAHQIAEATKTILEAVEQNGDRDAVVRHAVVVALEYLADEQQLSSLSTHRSDSVRLAAVLALRRRSSPLVADFLDDKSSKVLFAAVRAIHDVPIESAWRELALLLERDNLPQAVVSRAINANWRLGTSEHAHRLIDFARNRENTKSARQQAMKWLGSWADNVPTDRVTGAWRPLPVRSALPAQEALTSSLPTLLKDHAIAEEVALAAENLAVDQPRDLLARRARSKKLGASLRCSALRSLAKKRDALFHRVQLNCMTDACEEVAIEAISLVAASDRRRIKTILDLVQSKRISLPIRQAALDALGRIDAARDAVAELLAAEMPDSLSLELNEAARQHGLLTKAVSAAVGDLVGGIPKSEIDQLLCGGDPIRGAAIFRHKERAQCIRCHNSNDGQPSAGPSLVGIGRKQTRRHILQSILEPGQEIVADYSQVSVGLVDGTLLSGRIEERTDRELILIVDRERHPIPQSEIEHVSEPVSAMPAGFGQRLTRRELRDLVAYLSEL